MISTLRAKFESREPAQRQATWFCRTGQPGAKAQLYNRFPAPAARGRPYCKSCSRKSGIVSYPRAPALITVSRNRRSFPEDSAFINVLAPAAASPKNSAFLNVFLRPAAFRKTQPISMFYAAGFCAAGRALPKNSAFITVLARSHCIPRELSFYHCFGSQSLQPTATQLLSPFWPASHCTPQELNVYQCFALSRAIAQELIFSHCFSEPSATYEKRSIYHFFGLQFVPAHINSAFLNVLLES